MLIPYINFHGQCRDALAFYQAVFDATAENVYPYGDYVPDGIVPPEGLSEWIMHAELDVCGSRFWFADEAGPVAVGSNVKLGLTVDSTADAERIFQRLSEGGQVSLPPTETFYSRFHAAVTDRFGVCWNVVSAEPPREAAP